MKLLLTITYLHFVIYSEHKINCENTEAHYAKSEKKKS
jgi:hypothetical protein